MILSAYWEHISLLLAKQLNFDFSLNYKVTVLGNFNTIYCSVYWQSSKYAKAEVAALPQHWQRQPCVGLERKVTSRERLPRYPVQTGSWHSLWVIATPLSACHTCRVFLKTCQVDCEKPLRHCIECYSIQLVCLDNPQPGSLSISQSVSLSVHPSVS